MFRASSVQAVWQKHHQARSHEPLDCYRTKEQIQIHHISVRVLVGITILTFSSSNESINYNLGSIEEISKLRLPNDKIVRMFCAVAIFKAEDSLFWQCGVGNLKAKINFITRCLISIQISQIRLLLPKMLADSHTCCSKVRTPLQYPDVLALHDDVRMYHDPHLHHLYEPQILQKN